jgi:hypothetical protein
MIEKRIEELFRLLVQAEASWDLEIYEIPDLSNHTDVLIEVFNTPLDAPAEVTRAHQRILERLSRLIRLQRDHAKNPIDTAIWSGMKMSTEVALMAEARWPAENSSFFTFDPSAHRGSEEYLTRDDGKGVRWAQYSNHLVARGNRSSEAVDALSGEVSQIVRTVPSPTAIESARAHHVLVVGYTQSGKTQNFLGVASRLADAGYRLIIILSGRTEILGAQTQRRVDRDLVGSGGAEDGDLRREYQNEVDRSFTVNPKIGTTMAWKSLSHLVEGKHKLSLEGLQAFSGDQSTTFIAVCKKTSGDLKLLTKWAKEQSAAGRSDWPTILIDEEADDASPDTQQKADSEGWITREDIDDASFVNRSILELRDAFKTRTYIGYTATPYANCLADPDSGGLFPDAIYVMKMPTGYFGSHKVFDFVSAKTSVSELRVDDLKNEAIHVREVPFSDAAESEEARITAFKSWLVAGVIKEHRRKTRGGVVEKMLRHHSLLVNVHQSKIAHDDEYAAFKRIIDSPALSFTQNRPAVIAAMLWEWYVENFQDTTIRMLDEGIYDLAMVPGVPPLTRSDLPSKTQFLEVAEDVTGFLRVQFLKDKLSIDYPLQLVNSKPGTNEPNYDDPKLDPAKGLWVILIGGNKLARGFTVEGLTTTYFGRVSKTVDTMLQQARWNGFRAYYEDLIRLYFQNDPEKDDTQQPLALFRGAALTEYETRLSLEQYSAIEDQRIDPKAFLPGISGIGKRAPTNRTKMKGAVGNRGFEIGLVWGLSATKSQLVREAAQQSQQLEYPCGCPVTGPFMAGDPLAARILETKDVLGLYDAITTLKSRPSFFRQNIERAQGKWISFIETESQTQSVRGPRKKDVDRPVEEQASNVALRDGDFNKVLGRFKEGVCPTCTASQIPKVVGALFIVSNLYSHFAPAGEGQIAVPAERQFGMRVEFSGGAEYFAGRSRGRSGILSA